MLIYDVAIVKDAGKFWEVTGISKNSFDVVVDEQDKHLNLEATTAQLIKQAMEEGKLVRINKPIASNEVLPNEIQIISNDVDELQYAKDASNYKVRSKIRPELTKESGYTMYEFMIKNNELASKGYFITDSNREEKYIEIIETGDMELIELLESYLEAKDKIDRAYHLKDKIEKYRKQVNSADSVEKVQELEDAFVTELFNYIV